MTLIMSLKFATRKWYVINDQNNGEYGEGNEMIQALSLKQKLLNHIFVIIQMRAYILVTGNITVVDGNRNTKVAFKNCAQFTRCVTYINDEHIDTAENLDIIMNMYNLIEYSDNYSDTSRSLWQFKRDEQNMNNAGNPDNVTTNHSSSFKYKSNLLGDSTVVGDNRVFKNVKLAVPLKYLSNFFRSLELPLINCKIRLELNWCNSCVMSDIIGDASFKTTNTKLYIPIVTL